MARILRAGSQLLRAGGAAVWYRAGGAPAPVFAYQPKGAASLAASYVNLANPGTYNAAPGVAPTFDAATGWTIDATTQYLTTGIAIAANMTLIVRFSNADVGGSTNRVPVGARAGVGRSDGMVIYARIDGTRGYDYGNRVQAAPNSAVASAVLAIAGTKAYYNGADEGLTLNNNPTGPALYIGAMNQGGTATSFLSGKIQALAVWSSVLTAAQVLAVSTAMAAL